MSKISKQYFVKVIIICKLKWVVIKMFPEMMNFQYLINIRRDYITFPYFGILILLLKLESCFK